MASGRYGAVIETPLWWFRPERRGTRGNLTINRQVNYIMDNSLRVSNEDLFSALITDWDLRPETDLLMVHHCLHSVSMQIEEKCHHSSVSHIIEGLEYLRWEVTEHLRLDEESSIKWRLDSDQLLQDNGIIGSESAERLLGFYLSDPTGQWNGG